MTGVRREEPAFHCADKPEGCFSWRGTPCKGTRAWPLGHLPLATHLLSSQILFSKAYKPHKHCSTANNPAPPACNAKLPANQLSDSGCGKEKGTSRQERSSDISPAVPQVPICRRAGRRQADASPNKYEVSGPQGTIGALPATLAGP